MAPSFLAPLVSFALTGSALALQSNPVAPTVPSPLTRDAAPFSVRADVNAVTSVLQSSDAAWSALGAHEIVTVSGLPLGPTLTVDAPLRRIQPLTPDATIVAMQQDANGKAVPIAVAPPAVDFYGGSVLGKPGSRVFLAHGPAFTHGYALVDGKTFIITSGSPAGNPAGGGQTLPLISYELSGLPVDAIIWQPFTCETLTTDGIPQPNSEGGIAGTPACKHVKLALDSDNELNAVFGGDITATAGYLLLQAAAISEIYASNVNVRIQASYVRIWTAPDPWTQTSSGNQLYEFRDYWEANMGSATRNVAMLFSARGLGGGVAWLSAVCGPWGYSVSGNLAGSFPYPLQNGNGQNWDIMVTAHELGHNLGSPHTHNYCPPVDECAPDGYFGSCQTQQVCTNQGTIMSYCHLCDGGLQNVLLEFAPACRQSINEVLAAQTCDLDGMSQVPWAVPDFASTVSAPIALDVLANDLPVNCEGVVIEAFTQPPTGTVTRLVGAGPGGRDLLQYTSPPGWSGVADVTYTLRDASNQVGLPGAVRVQKNGYWAATSVIGALAAPQVDYYVLASPGVLPDFTQLSAYLTTTTTAINFPSTNGNFANSGRADQVGAVWTGWLQVPADSIYTLYVNSDDGSKLWIDDELLVNNDGLHGMVEKSGSAPLAAGKHKVRVEFFENGGGAGCIVSYSSSAISKGPVPGSAFSHGGTVLVADFNMDGSVSGADLGILLGQWGTAGPEADLDGSGIVDGADLGILLGAWTG